MRKKNAASFLFFNSSEIRSNMNAPSHDRPLPVEIIPIADHSLQSPPPAHPLARTCSRANLLVRLSLHALVRELARSPEFVRAPASLLVRLSSHALVRTLSRTLSSPFHIVAFVRASEALPDSNFPSPNCLRQP